MRASDPKTGSSPEHERYRMEERAGAGSEEMGGADRETRAGRVSQSERFTISNIRSAGEGSEDGVRGRKLPQFSCNHLSSKAGR